MIKNRKLVIKDAELAKYFNTAKIEQAIAEVPEWYDGADEQTWFVKLFDWSKTPQGYRFWVAVNDAFTVAPLPDVEIAKFKETIATAEATIADAKKRLAEMGE